MIDPVYNFVHAVYLILFQLPPSFRLFLGVVGVCLAALIIIKIVRGL